MNGWEIVRHQVAIAGAVTNAQTGKVIAGARVRITDAPAPFKEEMAARAILFGTGWETLAERPDQAPTSPEGLFYFLDLPDGQYTLTASLPESGSRFGRAQVQAKVSRGGQGRIIMAQADLALPATTIRGQITGTANTPVPLARVQVRGSVEAVFSNGQGCYLLAGVEKGTRTVLVSAQGYRPAQKTVSLSEAGKEENLDFSLNP